MVAHLRAEFVAPRHDKGHPDAALAQRRLAPALAAAERVGAVEPLARRAGVRRRAVVARNDDYRIFPDAEPFEFGDQPAYLAVEVGDHRGIGRPRPPRGEITLALDGLFVAEFTHVVLYVGIGRLHRAVGDRRRPHQEERPLLVGIHEFEHLVVHGVGAVCALRVFVVAARVVGVGPCVERRARRQQFVVEVDAPVVLPQEGRVVGVRLSLANAAVIGAEAHFIGRTLRRGASDAPFADHGRGVSGLLHDRAERRGAGFERSLSFERRIAQHCLVVPDVAPPFHLVVGADLSMAGVTPRQQAAACRRRERCRRVHVREADAEFAQGVDVGGLDLLLSVATEVAVACVVHQDEDHVGARSRVFRTPRCGQCGNGRQQCPGD